METHATERRTAGGGGALNALERGKYDPSLPLAFRIARLFKLRIEEIFHPDE